MRPVVVLDVVGLTPRDLPLAPRIAAVARDGYQAVLDTVLPAVTCSVQASLLTGLTPEHHGVVGNGWYFRDLAQVMFWRQSNQLVAGEKLYQAGKRRDPAFTCAKLFWWFNMYGGADVAVTPRPAYPADGRKIPDLHSKPAQLAHELQAELGTFPLFQFWGPGAGLPSTRWIVDSALRCMERFNPTLTLVYLPHLDYDHQRFGPEHPRSRAAVGEVDGEAGRLIDAARSRGAEVVVLSEYGITAVQRPVLLNRALREAGLLAVQDTCHGELLDAGACRAFAVADHQVAHVYVADPADLPRVRDVVARVPGVAAVLDRAEQGRLHLGHARAGELVCLSERDAWFAYPYWLDEARRPDFATTVDIHRKPGYDPVELLLDPKIPLPRLKIAGKLLRKFLGFRYLMDVISTDATLVKGSHGLLPARDEEAPVWLCSSRRGKQARIGATEVKERLLDLVFGQAAS
jgi:predicted AlkP superfamily pyrophosphatase or phosphodiesterase